MKEIMKTIIQKIEKNSKTSELSKAELVSLKGGTDTGVELTKADSKKAL